MRNLLTDLHKCDPVMRCEFLTAVIALCVLLDKFYNLSDFDFHRLVDFAIEDYF